MLRHSSCTYGTARAHNQVRAAPPPATPLPVNPLPTASVLIGEGAAARTQVAAARRSRWGVPPTQAVRTVHTVRTERTGHSRTEVRHNQAGRRRPVGTAAVGTVARHTAGHTAAGTGRKAKARTAVAARTEVVAHTAGSRHRRRCRLVGSPPLAG